MAKPTRYPNLGGVAKAQGGADCILLCWYMNLWEEGGRDKEVQRDRQRWRIFQILSQLSNGQLEIQAKHVTIFFLFNLRLQNNDKTNNGNF